MTCASFPGFVKIGRAQDAGKRLTQFQTASPYRDFALVASRAFVDCHAAELALHTRLSRYRRQGEWFFIDTATAVDALYTHNGDANGP